MNVNENLTRPLVVDELDTDPRSILDQLLRPQIPEHNYMHGIGTDTNLPPGHDYYRLHIDMNQSVDNYYPLHNHAFKTSGCYYNIIMPIRAGPLQSLIVEYSHDIVYRILFYRNTLSEIETWIKHLDEDFFAQINTPPFRFKFINVLMPILEEDNKRSSILWM